MEIVIVIVTVNASATVPETVTVTGIGIENVVIGIGTVDATTATRGKGTTRVTAMMILAANGDIRHPFDCRYGLLVGFFDHPNFPSAHLQSRVRSTLLI